MSDLPRYVMKDTDRRGNVRYYYRRGGTKTRLRGPLNSAEFFEDLGHAASNMTPKNSSGRIPSFVYFITYGNAKVKIGTCINARARLRALQTGIPGKARIRYLTPGGRRLEQELHAMFATDRVSGEWFQYSEAIRDWIEADAERRRIERQVNTPRSNPVPVGTEYCPSGTSKH